MSGTMWMRVVKIHAYNRAPPSHWHGQLRGTKPGSSAAAALHEGTPWRETAAGYGQTRTPEGIASGALRPRSSPAVTSVTQGA